MNDSSAPIAIFLSDCWFVFQPGHSVGIVLNPANHLRKTVYKVNGSWHLLEAILEIGGKPPEDCALTHSRVHHDDPAPESTGGLERVTNVLYVCDMLVDQERKIGDDPVGYKCGNPACCELPLGGCIYKGVRSDSGCALICRACLAIHKNEPQRLTLPLRYGKEWQEYLVKEVYKNMLERQQVDPDLVIPKGEGIR